MKKTLYKKDTPHFLHGESMVGVVQCGLNAPTKRLQLLNFYLQKQPFRVAVGKSKWFNYVFDGSWRKWNLREILNDEIVIEFDFLGDWEKATKQEQESFKIFAQEGIELTGLNLLREGFDFSIWEFGGKSPHLHIHNLIEINSLDKEKRKIMKKLFSKKYIPPEYHKYLDTSLCGIHLVALEYQQHWKGFYGIKQLVGEFGNE